MLAEGPFTEQARNILYRYPTLSLLQKNGITILTGTINILGLNGEILDCFQIEVFPGLFPNRYPIVFETGGKLPRNMEWHVYPHTGNCCLQIPPEERRRCAAGITLVQFFEEELIPYFYHQAYRRINGFYLNEYGHGAYGLFEYYAKRLKTSNIHTIISILEQVKQQLKPHRNAPCICSSGEKFRLCHRDSITDLYSTPALDLSADVDMLKRLAVYQILTDSTT